MENEILVLGPDDILESGINGIEEKDLPAIISSQINKLNELDQSVKKAMDAAEKAKDSADTAKGKSAGMFKKKVAIEELQSAGIDLAEAVQSGAEAQKISFEFQTKLAEITKYLFGLGVSNIASNRFVVRELEMKLKGATEQELSELARQELISVVKQLKDQEDILKKQENLSKRVKTHEEMLREHKNRTQEITNELKTHSDTDKLLGEQLKLQEEASKRLEEQLQAQAELDRLHSEQLQAQAEIDKLHEEQIRLQVENDKKLLEKLKVQEDVDLMHAEQLKIHAETDKKFEKLLETQAENDRIHDEKIKEQELKMKIMQDEINQLKLALETKANSTLLRITLGLAGLSTVIAVIACFL